MTTFPAALQPARPNRFLMAGLLVAAGFAAGLGAGQLVPAIGAQGAPAPAIAGPAAGSINAGLSPDERQARSDAVRPIKPANEGPSPDERAEQGDELDRSVTPAEAETLAARFGGLGAQPFQTGSGDITTCVYSEGGGDVIIRLTFTRVGGTAALDALRSTPGLQTIDNQGDEALFDAATGTLHVRKGDALISIVSGRETDGAAARLARDRSIADVAEPRI